jgi:hypothetical protein
MKNLNIEFHVFPSTHKNQVCIYATIENDIISFTTGYVHGDVIDTNGSIKLFWTGSDNFIVGRNDSTNYGLVSTQKVLSSVQIPQHLKNQFQSEGCTLELPKTSPEQPKNKPSRPPSQKPILPVIAKPTYPSPANLAKLAKQKPSGKPPSKTEEKERDDLRKKWKPKNPLVTPFIGGWHDPNGEEIFIYPSTQEKRICSVRAIGDKYDIQHNIVMGNAEGKDVLIGKTKQLFSLGTPNVLAIRDSKTAPLRQLVAIPGSPDLSAGDAEELERRGCIASLPGNKPKLLIRTGGNSRLLDISGELSSNHEKVDHPITIKQSGVLTVVLKGLSDNADVSLIDQSNRIIALLPEDGTTEEKLRRFIQPGNYVISVRRPKYQSDEKLIKYTLESNLNARESDDRKFKIQLDFSAIDEKVSQLKIWPGDAEIIKQAANDAVARWESVIVQSSNDGYHLINLKVMQYKPSKKEEEKPEIAKITIATAGADEGYSNYLAGIIDRKADVLTQATLNVNTNYNDTRTIVSKEHLTNTMIHEIGHVLGINPANQVFLDQHDVSLGNKSVVECAKEGGNVLYVGKYGVRSYQELLQDSGVQNNGLVTNGKINEFRKCDTGIPTDNMLSHWLDSRFGNEVMSAYVEGGKSRLPLSKFTISVLRDMGWQVNYGAADDYQLPKESSKPKSKKR